MSFEIIPFRMDQLDPQVREKVFGTLDKGGIKINNLTTDGLTNTPAIDEFVELADQGLFTTQGMVMPFGTNSVSGTEAFLSDMIHRNIFSIHPALKNSKVLLPTRPLLVSGAMSVLDRLGEAINRDRFQVVSTDHILRANEDILLEEFLAHLTGNRKAASDALSERRA